MRIFMTIACLVCVSAAMSTTLSAQNYRLAEPEPEPELALESVIASPSVDPEEPRMIRPGGFPSLGVDSNQQTTPSGQPSRASSTTPMVTTCSALAVVLGLFAALVWVSRKYGSKTLAGTLPNELVEVLGTSTIDAKTQLMMMRIGSRVVVATRGPQGLQPLSEITDPDEVQHVVSLCTGKAKATFKTALQDFQNEPTAGFAATAAPVKRSNRLFATA